MSIKKRIMEYSVKNTKLTAFIYDCYKSSEEKEIQQLVYEMGQVDTIMDITPLLILKKRIVKKKQVFWSHNANKTSYRLYGIGNSLFGKQENIYMTPSIEHGLIFYNKNWSDTLSTARASCVTFGPFRKRILRRYYGTPIFEVGPYIQYAEDYYLEKQMKEWKKKLGKTLLVFPMHSTDASFLKYNMQKYIKEIEKRAKKFDSVIVCVFWWNIDDPIVSMFQSLGYYISSAGYREDEKFLSRQKAMIDVSDHIISDSIGTHIGYCYSLGKTAELISAETKTDGINDSFQAKQVSIIKDAMLEGDGDKIAKLMKFYWGNGIKLSKVELSKICEINKEITLAGSFWQKRYRKAAEGFLEEYKKRDLLKYELLRKAIN